MGTIILPFMVEDIFVLILSYLTDEYNDAFKNTYFNKGNKRATDL